MKRSEMKFTDVRQAHLQMSRKYIQVVSTPMT